MNRLVLLVVLVGGCRSFAVTTPPGYVALNDQEPLYQYRATTADGVVLAVRTVDNDPHGDESFWIEAIKNRMRTLGGYAFLEGRAVKCQSGITGQQLLFGHDEGASPHLYYLTIFVTSKNLYLLEAGGPRPLIERDGPKLEAFVTTFVPSS